MITGARAPVALSIGRSFAAAGDDVHFVDCVPSLMTRWSAVGRARLHRVSPPRQRFDAFRKDMAELVDRLDPALIFPTCEEVFYLARAAALDGYAARLFAPPLPVLRALHSKADMIGLATEAGLDPPRSWVVASRDELRAFEGRCRELVFKPEFSRFAARTLVRPSLRQTHAIVPTPERRWVVQEYVAGEELSVWSAAKAGTLLAAAAYRPRWQFGGAGSYFSADADPRLAQACAAIARHKAITGQISLDLIRTADGALRPIECNPRSVSGVQLLTRGGALADAVMGRMDERLEAVGGACFVGPAFWSAAASAGLPRDALRDARAGDNVLARGGDPWVTAGALLDFARFGLRAAVAGRSAGAQSTVDIEWNGEPI